MPNLRSLAIAVGIVTVTSTCLFGQSERLSVVTTLGYLREIAEAVGGDRVSAKSLAAPNQDPHFVRPRPTLMKACREADLFIETGMQLELWTDKVISGSGNLKIQRGLPSHVIAARGINPLQVPPRLSRAYGDIHPSGNPHVWLDPLNVRIIAANIAAALESVDPAHRTGYQERLEAFQERIDRALFGAPLLEKVGARKLVREARRSRLLEYLERKALTNELGGWLEKAKPLRGRPLITHHRLWVYFARRFGIEIPLEIEERPGILPSARHRDRVVETVKELKVKTLLVGIFYDPSAAEYVASKTGATVVRAPCDIGPEVGIVSYFQLIDELITQLVAAEERES